MTTHVRASHRQALNADVPLVALATFARWWQFETWLRSLLYLELRAADGLRWESRIGSSTRRRARDDAQNSYMASPDAGNLLAYLEVTDLFALIDDDATWPLVKDALVPRPRWRGVVAQIGPIRHRLTHARRPHSDDLGRLEQVLRDLETGARRAVGAYFETYEPPKTDPLTMATATDEFTHLVGHVERNYEIDFRLSYSLRPWTKMPRASQAIAGRPGALWHARFYFRGERLLRPEAFWLDYKIAEPRDSGLLVHAVFPSPKELIVTFAAVDDALKTADAIEACIECITGISDRTIDEKTWRSWGSRAGDLDPRVHVTTAWARYTELTDGSIFGASAEPSNEVDHER